MAIEKIKSLLDQLNKGIYEKEEVMALALLSSIAGESIFLLGPPGVAKSLIARRLKYAYEDGNVFEYLMSRFSTPDEIFGPVSIKELKEDKYERIIDNYLPSASVVFLDEIWKAGPSIQNALLTILNEKKFRNGDKEIDIPIKALISASNELPAKDQGLEALWDRFLVRLVVEGIKEQEKFDGMIKMSSNPLEFTITDEYKINEDDYKKWNVKINGVTVPENVLNVIHVIRSKIERHNQQNEENQDKKIYVSDRRWRKIVRLMRTSAFINERKEVDLMDCFLIKHCIWNEKGQIQAVSTFVNDAIREYGPSIDWSLSTENEQFDHLTEEIEKNTRKKIGDKPKVQSIENDNYYMLDHPYSDKYFLIESSVVDNATESSNEITIFLGGLKDNTSCYITKGTEKNSVQLREDSNYGRWQPYELQTEPDIKPYRKSPSRADFQVWNAETENLLSVLEQKKTEADDYWNTFAENFYTNVFVDKQSADEHIKFKIDTFKIDVNELKERIEKIRSNYQRIYKDK